MHADDPLIGLGEGRTVRLSAIRATPDSRSYYLSVLHSSSARPVCRCVPDGVPMGIGRRTAGLVRPYLYLYPLHRSDGELHARLCPNRHSSSAPGLEGATPASELPQGVQHHSESEVGPPEQASVRFVLERLLAEAGLNLWLPTFEGHRTYGQVRHRLMAASVDLATRLDDPIPHRLYIPPVFAMSHKAAIEDAFQAFIAPATDSTARRFIFGKIRDVEIRPDSWSAPRLRLVETNEQFWLNQVPCLVPLPFDPTLRWVALLEIRPSPRAKAGFTVVDAAASLVTEQAVPVHSPAHAALADSLVGSRSSFRSSLEADPDTAWAFPDLVLTPADGPPARLAPQPCRVAAPRGVATPTSR